MNDTNLLDKIVAELRAALPSGLPREIEQNLRAGLTAALARLNLVTREELEVQTAVLARTRARLEELEKQVAAMEKALLKK